MKSLSRPLLLAFLWGCSLAATFLAGRHFASPPVLGAAPANAPRVDPARPAAPGFSDVAAPSGTRIAALVERKAGEARADRDRAAPAAGKPTSRSAEDVLTTNDPLERTARFLDLLRGLDAESAPRVLEAFEEGRYGYDRSREYALFLYAWGQVDGPAAARYLQEKPGSGWDKMRDMQSILSGWATRDAEASLAWAKEHWKGEENPYLIGVINGVAKSDLSRASQLAQELPYGRVRGQVADLLVDGHLQQGDRVAMDWAQSITDERLREGVVRRVALKVGEREPAMAADWVLQTVKPEGRPAAIEGIMETWGRLDPAAAARWADGQSDEAVRREAVAELAGDWARRDPEQAAAWVVRQPEGALRDQAIESYARGLRRQDPATAMRWAGSIQETDKRRALLERIMNEWTERDPQAAKAFLDAGGR